MFGNSKIGDGGISVPFPGGSIIYHHNQHLQQNQNHSHHQQSQNFSRKLDTKGCCFLCLSMIDYKTTASGKQTVQLKSLRRYLQIKTGNVNGNNLNGSSSGGGGVDDDIYVDLCESCGGIVNKFTGLLTTLEKIQTEVNFCLGQIHQQISEAFRKPDVVQNYSARMRMMTSSDTESLNKLIFVDDLRKEIALEISKKRNNIPTFSQQTNVSSTKSEGGAEPTPSTSSGTASSSSHHNDAFPLKKMYNKNGRGGTYSCSSCKKEFTSRPGVIHHYEVTHLGKRHECDRCGLNVTTIQSLVNHKKKCDGTGSRKAPAGSKSSFNQSTGKYHCKLCNKEYTTSQSVRFHYESFHLGKRYKCENGNCSSSVFQTKFQLSKHLETCRSSLPGGAAAAGWPK